MALLTSCWFIIESVIIPDGLLKWFYLSFFIHPLILVFCQVFLWLRLLKKWLSLLVFPLRFIFFVGFCLFRSLSHFVFRFLAYFGLVNVEVPIQEVESLETPQICSQNLVAHRYSWSKVAAIEGNIKDIKVIHTIELDDQEDDFEECPSVFPLVHEDSSSIEDLSSVCSSNSPLNDEYLVEDFSSISSSNSPPNDPEMNMYLPSDCSTNMPVMERELVPHGGDENEEDEESDPFYNKYEERMRWFDVLNYERTCGISAMLNMQTGPPNSFESIKPVDFSLPFMAWSKMSRRKLLRSLESDFEMVYVAQSCLSWEVLHHQYRKVEALACLQTGFFYTNVAGKFQKFQILLERFMEDERYEGKRFGNYARRRFSSKSLLQVPEVSGFVEAEKEGVKGEAMRPREVLKAIEKCIKAFWEFVKTDNKKSWPKFRSLLWTHPTVEDPRDLELLADLCKRLQKKELWMKDLQGKKRCWLKKSIPSPVGESQKKEMLFTMIDMKIVSRVLHMSLISSSQLRWCQEKLDNIKFKEGSVIRGPATPLFPSS